MSRHLALADGRLTLAELQEGVVDVTTARLLTLSVCETGLSDVLRGSAAEYVALPTESCWRRCCGS
jgi:CHAT domain-containing protein